jgi:hypothetical protein
MPDGMQLSGHGAHDRHHQAIVEASVNGAQAVLIAIGTRELDDCEFHLSVSKTRGSLFFVIVIYYQTRVNHSRNPAEQS